MYFQPKRFASGVMLLVVAFGCAYPKVLAANTYTTELKNGTEYTFTCPFNSKQADSFFPLVSDEVASKCDGKDFSVDSCDDCYEAILKGAYDKFKNLDPEEILAQFLETFSMENLAETAQEVIAAVNPALIKEIDWSKGCPYAKACRRALVSQIEDPEVAEKVKAMVKNCLGSKPGPDYDDAFKLLGMIREIMQGFQSTIQDSFPGQSKVDPGCSSEKPIWNASKKACVTRESCPGIKVNGGCSCEKPKWDKEKQRCVA